MGRWKTEDKPIKRVHLAITAVVVGLGLIGGALGYLYYAEEPSQNTENLDPITMFPPVIEFSLTDHTGKAVTNEDYRGKLMLVAFGYTFCPDICPTGLWDMTMVMNALGAQADWVQPIFITVDPERDTAEALAEYLAAFHPSFVGLTGTPEQIASAAKTAKAHYFRSEPAEGVDEDEYSMGHTTSIYLVGIDGNGLAVFNFGMAPTAVDAMTERIRHFVNIQEVLAKSG